MLKTLTESPDKLAEIIKLFCEKYEISSYTFERFTFNCSKFFSCVVKGSSFWK